MLSSAQLANVVHEIYTFSAVARGYHISGDDGRARDYATIVRHARRRLRAHVRQRRQHLRSVVASSERNIIGRMVVDQILREEVGQ